MKKEAERNRIIVIIVIILVILGYGIYYFGSKVFFGPLDDFNAKWNFEGDANDVLGISNGILTGASITPEGKLNLEGNNNYMEVVNNPALNPSRITIAMWVKPSLLVARNDIIKKDGSYWFNLQNGKLAVFLQGIAPAPGYYMSDSTINANEWTHIAFTYDGSQVKLYINGNLDKTHTGLSGNMRASLNNLIIGYHKLNNEFNGEIDEPVIYNRALNDDEVRTIVIGEVSCQDADIDGNGKVDSDDLAIVRVKFGFDCSISDCANADIDGNGNVDSDDLAVVRRLFGCAGGCGAVPYDALVGHWNFDVESVTSLGDRFTLDSGQYKSDAFIYGATAVPGKFGKAYSFDGDDWIDLGLSTDNVMQEGTISYWVKPASTVNGLMVGAPYGIEPIIANGKLKLSFLGSTLLSQGSISTTDWSHVVITWNSNGVKAFINGIKEIDSSSVKGPLNLNSRSLRIGTRENNNWFKGEIDDVMIFNIALDDSQVVELFNGKKDFVKTINACDAATEISFYNSYLNDYPDSFTDEQLLNYNVYALYGSQERNFHGRNKAIMGRIDSLRSAAGLNDAEFYATEYFDRFMLLGQNIETFAPKWTDNKQGGGTWMPSDAMYARVRAGWRNWQWTISYLQSKGWTWNQAGEENYPTDYLPYNVIFKSDNTYITQYRKMRIGNSAWRTHYLDFIKAHNDVYGYDGIMVERWPSKVYQYMDNTNIDKPFFIGKPGVSCKLNNIQGCLSGENLLSNWFAAGFNPGVQLTNAVGTTKAGWDWWNNKADGHFAPPDENLYSFASGSIAIPIEAKSKGMKVWILHPGRVLTGARIAEIEENIPRPTFFDSVIANYDYADIIQIPQSVIDTAGLKDPSGNYRDADLYRVLDAFRNNGAIIYINDEVGGD